MDEPSSKCMAHFSESIFMLIQDTAALSRHASSLELYSKIRQAWNDTHPNEPLPSFGQVGLNRAWSGSQTLMDVTGLAMREHLAWVAAGNEDCCKACGRKRPENSHSAKDGKCAEWRGYQDEMRCQPCHTFFRKNKYDKIGPVSIQDHDHWLTLDPNHLDKCYGFDGKCTTTRPRPYTGSVQMGKRRFIGSRCFPCYDAEHSYPDRKRRYTRAMHLRWVNAGNADVCGSCKETRPPFVKGQKTYWQLYMEEARCGKCHRYRREHGRERPVFHGGGS